MYVIFIIVEIIKAKLKKQQYESLYEYSNAVIQKKMLYYVLYCFLQLFCLEANFFEQQMI